ncbi:MAG: hypothetical protein D5S03_02660 [Desulfonatronospira sp. MSAO_Bac3]|nr:MAG: hypothetical protein D5S03_02660 [Desulfonatronospira sp. MSAO_Bac3]
MIWSGNDWTGFTDAQENCLYGRRSGFTPDMFFYVTPCMRVKINLQNQKKTGTGNLNFYC